MAHQMNLTGGWVVKATNAGPKEVWNQFQRVWYKKNNHLHASLPVILAPSYCLSRAFVLAVRGAVEGV